MSEVGYTWNDDGNERSIQFVYVEGTHGTPYQFGTDGGEGIRELEVGDFFISITPITQSFWAHVMGQPPACYRPGLLLPVENVSWDELTHGNGFLARLQQSDAGKSLLEQAGRPDGVFRLPSEAEWEYAARGGPHWPDGYRYSGSNEIEQVAWFDRRHGDHTQEVAQKAPNQLGLYDMSGNVWEWCQDAYTRDVQAIRQNGSPVKGEGPEHVLRGGCFHNWAIHCTVAKRYQIGRECHDGCIGFRMVISGS